MEGNVVLVISTENI